MTQLLKADRDLQYERINSKNRVFLKEKLQSIMTVFTIFVVQNLSYSQIYSIFKTFEESDLKATHLSKMNLLNVVI